MTQQKNSHKSNPRAEQSQTKINQELPTQTIQCFLSHSLINRNPRLHIIVRWTTPYFLPKYINMAGPSIDSVLYSNTLSRNSTGNNIIPLTVNARKYGEGVYFTGLPKGKSGLTPTQPFLGTIPQSEEEYTRQFRLEDYQKYNFFGFSSQDLTDILAAEKLDAQPSSLWKTSSNSASLLGVFNPFAALLLPSFMTPVLDPDADDNIGIMPFLQRDNWDQNLAWSPILGTIKKHWDTKSDEVWKAMKPSLQLASRILNDPQTNS